MRKRDLTAMHFLKLVFLTAVYAGAQGAPTTIRQQRSVALNSYNTWHITTSADHQDPAKLQAGVNIWSQFDSVSLPDQDGLNYETPGWTTADPTAIKTLNPSAKIYMYYAAAKCTYDVDWLLSSSALPFHRNVACPIPWYDVDAHDWWLRDDNGVRMQLDSDHYMLDFGKSGVKESFLQDLMARISGKPVYGVILDYVLPDLSNPALAGYTRPAAYLTDADWFNKAYVPFATYVFDGLHKAGYKTVGGCVDYSTRTQPYPAFLRSKIDINIYEVWITNWDGSWLPQYAVAQRILDFAQDPLECWAADFGLRAGIPDFERKHSAALAMYYVSLPSSATALRSFHYYSDTPYWHALWNWNIGTPSGASAKLQNRYFWSRQFTRGVVFLNYEDTQNTTVALPRKCKDVNGKQYVGSVTVPPKTGLILAFM